MMFYTTVYIYKKNVLFKKTKIIYYLIFINYNVYDKNTAIFSL